MLLTIPEACAAVRVGRTKLYQLLNSGEIKAVKIGKKTLISMCELNKFINLLPKYKP
jgi:excisionase family DNA binding protein